MAAPTEPPDVAALLAQLAQALAERQREPEPPKMPEPRPMPQRVLLTVEEAGEQLGIKRTKAWELVSTGQLVSVLVGRLRRVPSTAVTEYATRLIAQQSRTPTT